MSLKSIILFRFHKEFDGCKQNIRILRGLNPGVPVHGMYGGFGGVEALPDDLVALFDTVRALPMEDPFYNWMHGDLCVRWWFKEIGHTFSFDHLCLVEWDLLYLKPMNQIVSFEKDTNYMAVSDSYDGMMKSGWPWITGAHQRRVEALLDIFKKRSKPVPIEELSFAIMGGCVMCRKFLELYAKEFVPSYSNDEVRMALFSRFFDIPVLDMGLVSNKKNSVDAATEVEDKGFTLEQITEAVARDADVLHPVRCVREGLEDILLD